MASTGIEPVSGASETLILSIVLRGLYLAAINKNYLINPPTLLVNIFTAIANKITPKNFRTAAIPEGPNNNGASAPTKSGQRKVIGNDFPKQKLHQIKTLF